MSKCKIKIKTRAGALIYTTLGTIAFILGILALVVIGILGIYGVFSAIGSGSWLKLIGSIILIAVALGVGVTFSMYINDDLPESYLDEIIRTHSGKDED